VLAKLAGQAGIPLSILQAGMKSQKDQQEFDNLMEKQKNTPSISEQYGTGIIGEYNYAKVNGYKGSFEQYQNEDANRKRSVSVSNTFMGNTGLTKDQWNNVQKITGQFDGEAITKKYNQVAEGYTFASSMDNNSNNPADDQALIYSFAKAMDPDSVVREGEYATVQKYSQSWLENFGFNAQRVVANKEFLTPEARANIKSSIGKKYNAIKPQYDNLYNEYGRRIDQVTGQSGTGSSYITNYGNAYSSPEAPTGNNAPPKAPGTLDINGDSYTYVNRDGTVHTGKLGDNYADNTSANGDELLNRYGL
jgi:hypothetical protein